MANLEDPVGPAPLLARPGPADLFPPPTLAVQPDQLVPPDLPGLLARSRPLRLLTQLDLADLFLPPDLPGLLARSRPLRLLAQPGLADLFLPPTRAVQPGQLVLTDLLGLLARLRPLRLLAQPGLADPRLRMRRLTPPKGLGWSHWVQR